MRKSLAPGELFYAHDQAQLNPIGLRHIVRRHSIVEIVQHRLNRHTRLFFKNRRAVQIAGIRHGEIEFRPIHIQPRLHSICLHLSLGPLSRPSTKVRTCNGRFYGLNGTLGLISSPLWGLNSSKRQVEETEKENRKTAILFGSPVWTRSELSANWCCDRTVQSPLLLE